MSKSLISNERKCLVCGQYNNLHKHHCIYGAGRRKLSEKYGLWVYLCPKHHNMSNAGVHYDKALDLKVKQLAQNAFENHVGARDEFIKVFGRNYL